MKKFISMFAIAAMALCMTACEASDGDDDEGQKPGAGGDDVAQIEGFLFDDAYFSYTYDSDGYLTSIKIYEVDSDFEIGDSVEGNDPEVITYEYNNDYVVIYDDGYKGLRAYINDEGYVSKLYEYQDETNLSSEYYEFTYSSAGYITKYSYVEDDCTTTGVVTWSNGNLTSIFFTAEFNDETATEYSYDEFTYGSVTIPDCNMNISFIFTIGDDDMMLMPTSWFGKMSVNNLTQVKYSEPETTSDPENWEVMDDNNQTFTTTYDTDGNVASISYISKFVKDKGDDPEILYFSFK